MYGIDMIDLRIKKNMEKRDSGGLVYCGKAGAYLESIHTNPYSRIAVFQKCSSEKKCVT